MNVAPGRKPFDREINPAVERHIGEPLSTDPLSTSDGSESVPSDLEDAPSRVGTEVNSFGRWVVECLRRGSLPGCRIRHQNESEKIDATKSLRNGER